jgi:hypothetical protein
MIAPQTQRDHPQVCASAALSSQWPRMNEKMHARGFPLKLQESKGNFRNFPTEITDRFQQMPGITALLLIGLPCRKGQMMLSSISDQQTPGVISTVFDSHDELF